MDTALVEVARFVVTTLVAGGLAFAGNRFLDSKRARREFGSGLLSDLRADVREIVETAVEYWSGGIAGPDRAKLEAKIRLLEQDFRHGISLLNEELAGSASAGLNALYQDLVAELTGGAFEARPPVWKRSSVIDVERARRIAAIGGKLRTELSRAWKTDTEKNGQRIPSYKPHYFLE